VLRTLVQRIDGRANSAFITNSTLPFDEMLEYALADLGVPDPRGTRAQRLIALNRFLIEQRRAGRNTVIIVDEAQNLSIETLEQIRLLSNFETNSAKLLQIVLSGQPEIWAKLQQPELRQLKQRIGLRCWLTPMTVEQVSQYIAEDAIVVVRGRVDRREEQPRIVAMDLALPDVQLGVYDWVLAWDHLASRAWIISTGMPETNADARLSRARERASSVLVWLRGDARDKTAGLRNKARPTLSEQC